MSNINEFLRSYSKILEIIIKYGFKDAVIFKGFTVKEERNLNLLVSDKLSEGTESMPQTTRRLKVIDELSALLKCKVVFTLREQMDIFYRNKLNASNSVELKAEIPLRNIEKVFGKNWRFNPLDNVMFWKTSPIKKAEETQPINNIQPPSELLIKELTEYVKLITQQQAENPVNLDAIFAGLKQAVVSSIHESSTVAKLHV